MTAPNPVSKKCRELRTKKRITENSIPKNCRPPNMDARFSFSQTEEIRNDRLINADKISPTAKIITRIVTI